MSNIHSSNSQKEKRDYWSAQIQNYYLSELTQKEFCSRNCLTYSTFCYWKRILAQSAESDGIEFVEVDPDLVRETAVAVTLTTDRCSIRIHNGADTEMVERILKGLKL